jgi:uncharacterized integral membrane protein
MRYAKSIFWVIIGFLILWILYQNVQQRVNIDLIFTEFQDVDLVIITITCLLIGFLLGAGILSVKLIREKKFNSGLIKKIKSLEMEYAKINPVKDNPDSED